MNSITTKTSESAFLKACRREKNSYTPIWLMRQAGRFMKEYRDIREKNSFLELCKNSDLASYVTVMAQEKLGVDAAIIFADILLPLEAMGVGLQYSKNDGPVIERPVRSHSDLTRLKSVDPADSLSFVFDAIKKTRAALKPDIPLIGFSGAPFTLASYLIEGGSSRNFENTKALMYKEPNTWYQLMNMLVESTANYLNLQIKSGAQVIQIFDSWVGCLSQYDYKEYVFAHAKKLIQSITPNYPVIHFGTGTAHLLELMRDAGGDVIGIDWRISLAEAWNKVGLAKAVQGNLDPTILFAGPQEIKKRAKIILDEAQERPGHIFNLGHGVLPGTPEDNVKYLVECVHELGRR